MRPRDSKGYAAAARTFAQAFIAGLLACGVLDVNAFEAAAFAGLTEVLSLLQGLVGSSRPTS